MIELYTPETVAVPRGRVQEIILGDTPSSVAEVDAVGALTHQFVGERPPRRPYDTPAFYKRLDGNGGVVERISPEEYGVITKRGSRATWRLDAESIEDFSLIARHTSIDEVPDKYLETIADAMDRPGGVNELRREAFRRVSLAQEIAMVEQTEREEALAAAQAKQVAELKAQMAARRMSRRIIGIAQVPQIPQENPPTETQAQHQRLHEIQSHRRPASFVSRAIGGVASKVVAFFKPQFAL